jgi:hypothetical protein
MGPRLIGCWIFIVVIGSSFGLATPAVQSAPRPEEVRLGQLWEPTNVEERDLFHGPWGAAHAPDPNAVYTFVREKSQGTNPGVVVRDPHGREWHVKQAARNNRGVEGPAEVAMSRVLSAVGFHQPPVYFLPAFTMATLSGMQLEPGGRFRLHDGSLTDSGEWSWQQNPFVGTRPYAALLVILLMFNSSDLKNSNNSVYEVTRGQQVDRWYVVRDLGSSLGETARFRPRRNDIDRFERSGFIRGVSLLGYVEFDYHGKNAELVRRRITPADLGWATDLLGRLSPHQWNDAFRAGGYAPDVTARYISVLDDRLARAREIARMYSSHTERR